MMLRRRINLVRRHPQYQRLQTLVHRQLNLWRYHLQRALDGDWRPKKHVSSVPFMMTE